MIQQQKTRLLLSIWSFRLHLGIWPGFVAGIAHGGHPGQVAKVDYQHARGDGQVSERDELHGAEHEGHAKAAEQSRPVLVADARNHGRPLNHARERQVEEHVYGVDHEFVHRHRRHGRPLRRPARRVGREHGFQQPVTVVQKGARDEAPV